MKTLSLYQRVITHIQSGLFRKVCDAEGIEVPFAVHTPNVDNGPITLVFKDGTGIERLKEIFRDYLWDEPGNMSTVDGSANNGMNMSTVESQVKNGLEICQTAERLTGAV